MSAARPEQQQVKRTRSRSSQTDDTAKTVPQNDDKTKNGNYKPAVQRRGQGIWYCAAAAIVVAVLALSIGRPKLPTPSTLSVPASKCHASI